MTENQKAFLAMLRKCEGTDSVEGYRALFGWRPGNGKTFDSFAEHPNISAAYTQLDGTTVHTHDRSTPSTAHGAKHRSRRVSNRPV